MSKKVPLKVSRRIAMPSTKLPSTEEFYFVIFPAVFVFASFSAYLCTRCIVYFEGVFAPEEVDPKEAARRKREDDRLRRQHEADIKRGVGARWQNQCPIIKDWLEQKNLLISHYAYWENGRATVFPRLEGGPEWNSNSYGYGSFEVRYARYQAEKEAAEQAYRDGLPRTIMEHRVSAALSLHGATARAVALTGQAFTPTFLRKECHMNMGQAAEFKEYCKERVGGGRAARSPARARQGAPAPAAARRRS